MSNMLEGKNIYGKYCVPEISKHRDAAKLILSGKVYEPNTIKFMRENTGTGDVIHAGTYFGDFLPALSTVCKGTVWAFEPCSENYKCALKTIELNNLENVNLYNAALSNSHGVVSIKVQDNNLHRGGMSRVVSSDDFDEQVSSFRIDDIVPRNRKISILQLDVEGHELYALEGAIETIKQHSPIVILETDFTEFMEELNYKLLCKIHNNSVYIKK